MFRLIKAADEVGARPGRSVDLGVVRAFCLFLVRAWTGRLVGVRGLSSPQPPEQVRGRPNAPSPLPSLRGRGKKQQKTTTKDKDAGSPIRACP